MILRSNKAEISFHKKCLLLNFFGKALRPEKMAIRKVNLKTILVLNSRVVIIQVCIGEALESQVHCKWAVTGECT